MYIWHKKQTHTDIIVVAYCVDLTINMLKTWSSRSYLLLLILFKCKSLFQFYGSIYFSNILNITEIYGINFPIIDYTKMDWTF